MQTLWIASERSQVKVFKQCDFLQLYLGLCATVFLPLFAVLVVLFPLLAGRGGTIRVIMVKTIPQAFAVSEFTPVVITDPG